MKKALSIIWNIIDVMVSVMIYIFVNCYLAKLDPASVIDSGSAGLDITLWLSLAVMFILLFSLVRFSVLFDAEMREKFVADGEGLYSVPEHIRFLFSFPKTYIALGISVLMFFCFKIEQFAKPIFKLIIKSEPALIYKMMLLPIYLIVVLLIYYLASRSAARYWYEDKRRSRVKRIKYTLLSKLCRLLTLTVAYTFGAALFINVTYQISAVILSNRSILLSSKTLSAAITLLVIFVVIPFVIKQLKAILKRRKFIEELIAVCDEYHCSLSPIRHPYASLFKLSAGYDFDFERNGKKYACKMLYSKHRLRPMTFFDGGMGAHEKIIRVKKTELFRIRSWFEYSFDADAKKLLIINPIPKKLVINDHGRVALIDNGDSVDGYKIYSATAIVNAISRNTLDR